MAKTQNTQDKLALSPQAMDFLGLSQQPFTSTILSEDAIFTDASLDQLFETIQHHLQFSDLILIIEGDLGAGKTTLFRHLIQKELTNLKLLSIHAEATDTLVQIQQKMSIHLQDQGNANYLDDNLKRLQVFDQTPAVIIDDAHILSDATIQELIRYQRQLEIEHETKLKLLLLANKGMTKTLEEISDIQANQRYLMEIPEFTPKQINAFIVHRLKTAGYTGEHSLDEESIQYIYKKSNGLPSLIMLNAINRLENLTKKQTRSGKLSPIIIFVLLALVCLLAATGYGAYKYLMQTSQQAEFQYPLSTIETISNTDEEPVFEDTVPATQPDVTEHVTELDESHSDNLKTEKQLAIESVQTRTNLPVPAPVPEIEKQEPAQIQLAPVQKKETLLPEESTDTAEKSEAKLEPAPTELIPEIVIPEAIVKTAPVKELAKPITKINPILAELSTLGIHDGNWLRKQDKDNWTLQILGARDPETLLKFAKRHKLGAESAWYKTWLKGKPWYVLVHHFYTDRDIARQSISRLPADLQKSRPWVKKVASIHKVISK